MQKNYSLMQQLASPENLSAAWRQVRGNIPLYRRQRSAGPDGVTLAEFERDLAVNLSTLRHMLINQRYQPQPPAIFSAPKAGGGSRSLAVLNVVDRVAQRAAQQVLEPLWEPVFLPCSYGYRPGCSVQLAVEQARRMRRSPTAWVVDGDISACFDSLDQRLLLAQLSKRVDDPRLLELIKAWLATGVLKAGPASQGQNILAEGVSQAAGRLRQGVDWVMNSLDDQPEPQENDWQEADTFYPEYGEGEAYAPTRQARQGAARQALASMAVLGMSWARPALRRAGTAALLALKSPIAPAVLKKGLILAGGTAGVAAGAAVAAYTLYRRAEQRKEWQAGSARGILQGSPLSPLLANIYLHPFDLDLTNARLPLLRYADDWVIFATSQDAAEKAYNAAVCALDRIHLKVNREKTSILAPAQRLVWLGETIN